MGWYILSRSLPKARRVAWLTSDTSNEGGCAWAGLILIRQKCWKINGAWQGGARPTPPWLCTSPNSQPPPCSFNLPPFQQFMSSIHKRCFFPGLNYLGSHPSFFLSLWFLLFFLLTISHWLTLHGSTWDFCSQVTLHLQGKFKIKKKVPRLAGLCQAVVETQSKQHNIHWLIISNNWAPEPLSRAGFPKQ